MTSHNIIEMIDTVYDLPIHSAGSAIQAYNERARAGKYDYGNVLRSILGINCRELEDSDHARVQVAYAIQLAVELHQAGKPIDPKALYVEATKKTREFVQEMPWVFAKKEDEVKLDSAGKPRQKKGAKQVLAYEVYSRLAGEGATRKAIIQAFQDEVDMSKAGATTYFYNMKKKYEAENS